MSDDFWTDVRYVLEEADRYDLADQLPSEDPRSESIGARLPDWFKLPPVPASVPWPYYTREQLIDAFRSGWYRSQAEELPDPEEVGYTKLTLDGLVSRTAEGFLDLYPGADLEVGQ